MLSHSGPFRCAFPCSSGYAVVTEGSIQPSEKRNFRAHALEKSAGETRPAVQFSKLSGARLWESRPSSGVFRAATAFKRGSFGRLTAQAIAFPLPPDTRARRMRRWKDRSQPTVCCHGCTPGDRLFEAERLSRRRAFAVTSHLISTALFPGAVARML